MNEKLEQFGGGLVNIVLGAVILWVGQTTFQHAGILASVEQKFSSIDERFTDSDKRYDGLRNWIEGISSRSREDQAKLFSVSDGMRLQGKIEKMTQLASDLERKFAEHLKSLELKLVALEAKCEMQPDTTALRWELAQLRSQVQPAAAPAESATVPASAVNVAHARSPYPATTWQR